jgi:Uma2 family endonuclease
MDYLVKRAEYADAGIPYYWVVDVESPITLLAMRLVDDFGYVEDGEATGAFQASAPFECTVRLDGLTSRASHRADSRV